MEHYFLPISELDSVVYIDELILFMRLSVWIYVLLSV